MGFLLKFYAGFDVHAVPAREFLYKVGHNI